METPIVTPDETRWQKTINWLEQQYESGNWEQIAGLPVYVVSIDNGRYVVLDGSHRVDFASEKNLPLNNVLLIESDEDLHKVIQDLTSYGKVSNLSQIKRILSKRV